MTLNILKNKVCFCFSFFAVRPLKNHFGLLKEYFSELFLIDCFSPKARDTLHDFRLSQTKDWHRETIVAISDFFKARNTPSRRSAVGQFLFSVCSAPSAEVGPRRLFFRPI